MIGLDFSDNYLAKKWREIDWEAVEDRLMKMQARLTLATYRSDWRRVKQLQEKIVLDQGIQCLAVRRIAGMSAGPGVDGVRWKTDAQKMTAALEMNPQEYNAQPLRQVVFEAKNTGKIRRTGVPTYLDRAMQVLYGYTLLPVTEAMADRDSFAFRKGRSAHDALARIMEILTAQNAPKYVVCADVKSYYATLHHDWLLKHVPMDKAILRKFLNAGFVFAGELFPSDGVGISEGGNLSPYLGNFALDGLQSYLYEGLHDTPKPEDYQNGAMVRFADDVFVSVRTKEDGEQVLSLLKGFLSERGCVLSKEKTHMGLAKDGFHFLAHTFTYRNGQFRKEPSEAATNRFITNIKEMIASSKKSQRDLITAVNQKLRGWAAYYRYSDAEDAFRRVDVAVQAALLEAAIAKHPHTSQKKIITKYWYKEPDGSHVYALPTDKSVRVIRLADTLLLKYRRVRTFINPFLDRVYLNDRANGREMENITGPYRQVWARQDGKCHYCGRPILLDQERTLVPLDLSKKVTPKNAAYIHKICSANTYELIYTMEDVQSMRPYDVMAALKHLDHIQNKSRPEKRQIKEKWKYIKLKEYLSQCTQATISLSFAEIEEIIGEGLPPCARTRLPWWYPRTDRNTISEAWLTEGYVLEKLDLEKEILRLKRKMEGLVKLKIPAALTAKKIPDDAVFELEQHMAYIIKKYGL